MIIAMPLTDKVKMTFFCILIVRRQGPRKNKTSFFDRWPAFFLFQTGPVIICALSWYGKCKNVFFFKLSFEENNNFFKNQIFIRKTNSRLKARIVQAPIFSKHRFSKHRFSKHRFSKHRFLKHRFSKHPFSFLLKPFWQLTNFAYMVLSTHFKHQYNNITQHTTLQGKSKTMPPRTKKIWRDKNNN